MSPYRVTVLLVDDSDDDAFLITDALRQSHDFKVVWRATHGQEAIDYLRGAGTYGNRANYPFPDVMLLDLNMPHGSGFDVLAWLRTRTDRPKVVAITSASGPALEQRTLAAGADVLFQKPHALAEYPALIDSLKDFLRVARSG